MQAVFKTLLGRLVEYIDEMSEGDRPVDVITLSRLYAADVGSHVVYGSENSLNLLEDEGQRLGFQKDLNWTDNRFLTVWSLLMLWHPSASIREEHKVRLTGRRLCAPPATNGPLSKKHPRWYPRGPIDEQERA